MEFRTGNADTGKVYWVWCPGSRQIRKTAQAVHGASTAEEAIASLVMAKAAYRAWNDGEWCAELDGPGETARRFNVTYDGKLSISVKAILVD